VIVRQALGDHGEQAGEVGAGGPADGGEPVGLRAGPVDQGLGLGLRPGADRVGLGPRVGDELLRPVLGGGEVGRGPLLGRVQRGLAARGPGAECGALALDLVAVARRWASACSWARSSSRAASCTPAARTAAASSSASCRSRSARPPFPASAVRPRAGSV
jgi:hypothetical protein